MYKSFSHIYIEKEIENHPRTLEILQKFKNSIVVKIEHYKDIFNRRGQNFRIQKLSPKLILAKRKDHFLYPGSHFSPNFDHPHFYYNTLALNCLYDCSYCYLQGMFPSANLVFFVNWEDYFKETESFLEKNHSLYLALSYDTDLLATETFFPANLAWIEFARKKPNLLLEIRTKSANFHVLKNLSPIPNAILAWTISPSEISEKIEKKAPSLEARLTSIRSAIDTGWKVRICLDPILRVKDWKAIYSEFIGLLSERLNLNSIFDLSLGTFRMNSEFLSNIQTLRTDASLLYYPFVKHNGIASYSVDESQEMVQFLRNLLLEKMPGEKIKLSFDPSKENIFE